MKKVSLFFILFFTLHSMGQNQSFSFTSKGLTPFINEEFQNKDRNELYEKTLNWLIINKQKGKIFVKETKEKESILIEFIKSKILCDKYQEVLHCYDVKSTLLLSFFNGSYKFEIVTVELFIPSENRWVNFPLEADHQNKYFKKNGNIHSRYKLYPSTISSIFNSFNENLKNYIVNSK